jgi:glycosyltransferase involved in cell wall biosynthesis
MTALRLSVIMPVFNSRPFVGAAIDSILSQTFGDFVLYVVDDGSTDGSGDLVAEKAALDRRIHLIRQDNHGIVASLNRMLALVDTPFVARMDADDIAMPDRFARQLERMEAEPELGALGTQFEEIDTTGQRISSGAAMPVGTLLVHAELEHRQPIANPTTMFRTQALRDAGLYRAAFRYCEDYDLFLRLSEIARIDNLPDILFHYRRSPGQMSVLHHGVQTRQAAYARLAHRERLAGRPDPFAGADLLPPLSELDRVLGQPGVAAKMESEILLARRYAVGNMSDAEFAGYCGAIARGISGSDIRGIARCLAEGRPGRALRLAKAMAKGRLANRPTDG